MSRQHDRWRSPLELAALLAVLAIGALGVLLACGGGGDGAPAAMPPPPPSGLFPVRLEAGKRYLVDASGNPLLLHADTAWSLIADLSRQDAETYLEDRRQKGFNAIIVNLLERKYSSRAVPDFRNFYGEPPFSTTDNFDTPNEAYFAHADYVIRLAASKGILVLVAPSYLGFNGGPDGWYMTMKANGGRLRDYGRFLGRRYASSANILWLHGGDFNPVGDEQLVRDIALGIKEFDRVSLHSAHCAPETQAVGFWGAESWLQVNTVYTYNDVPAQAAAAYANGMPFFLLESRYENEGNPLVQERQLRAQAYQTLLSGGLGQTFGNHPIWHFDGPSAGAYPDTVPPNWEAWLNSRGAQSMVHVRALFLARAWWTLVPDFSNAFLTGGIGGAAFDRAVASKAGNGSFGIVYVPSSRTVTVALAQLAGPNVIARWFDPADGTFAAIGGSPFPNAGSRNFPTPGNNAAGYPDWVLVLESSP